MFILISTNTDYSISQILRYFDRTPTLTKPRANEIDAIGMICDPETSGVFDIGLTTAPEAPTKFDPFVRFSPTHKRNGFDPNPLYDIHSNNPPRVSEVQHDLAVLAERHGKFFEKFGRGRNPLTIEKLDRIVAEQDGDFTPLELVALLNSYKRSSLREFLRFNEYLRDRGIQTSDSNHADYIYALNRFGHHHRAIQEASDYLAEYVSYLDFDSGCGLRYLGSEDLYNTEIVGEHIIGIGTAYKGIWLIAKELDEELAREPNESKLHALDKASRAYAHAFPLDPEHAQVDKNLTAATPESPKWYAAKNLQDELKRDIPSSKEHALRTAKERYLEYFPKDDSFESVKYNAEQSLDMAINTYSLAFKASPSYYPGMCVLRTLCFKGELEKARALAPLIKQKVLQSDWRMSFWPKVAMLELAILEGDIDETSKWLTAVLKMASAQEPTEIESIINHLTLWAEADGNNRADLIQIRDAISGACKAFCDIDSGKFPQLELHEYNNVRDALVAYSLPFGNNRRGRLTKFNSDNGGLICDFRNGPAERETAREIMMHTGIISNRTSDEFDLDVVKEWCYKFAEITFRIRDDESNERKVERLDNVEHVKIDAFWKGMLKLVQRDISDIDATSVMALPAIGICDCRHVNSTMAYMLGESIRYQTDILTQLAFEAFLRNDMNRYEEILGEIKELNKTEVVMLQEHTYAPIQVDDKEQIIRNEDGVALYSGDDSKLARVDRHTVPAIIRYDDDGNVEEVEFIDAWYFGEKDDHTFNLRNKVVRGEALNTLIENGKGYLEVEDGVSIAKDDGEIIHRPARLYLRPYSGPINNKLPIQHDVISHTVVGQPDIDTPTVGTFYDLAQRASFDENFIMDVVNIGLEEMVAAGDKLAEHYQASLAIST